MVRPSKLTSNGHGAILPIAQPEPNVLERLGQLIYRQREWTHAIEAGITECEAEAAKLEGIAECVLGKDETVLIYVTAEE